MVEVTVVRKGDCQEVQLPSSVAFPKHVTRVDVIAVGRDRLLVPAGSRWSDFFDAPAASADFMADRT